jgi:hypothetical protein
MSILELFCSVDDFLDALHSPVAQRTAGGLQAPASASHPDASLRDCKKT